MPPPLVLSLSLSFSATLSLSLFLYDPDRAGLGISRKHVSLNPGSENSFPRISTPSHEAETKLKKWMRRIVRREGEHADESVDAMEERDVKIERKRERERGRARSLAQAWRCFPMPRTGTRQRERDVTSRDCRAGGSRRRSWDLRRHVSARVASARRDSHRGGTRS